MSVVSLKWFFVVVSLSLALIKGEALTVSDLSLEDKVGQLLMVWFEGDEANDEAAKLIKEARVGSIIYYRWANKLISPKQILNLSNSLQAMAKEAYLPPLLIALDEEGGVVSRLLQGFTDFPGNGALGRTEDPHLAFLEAQAVGTELKAVGINYNLAPVVDINNNPNNPVIGIRSFGNAADLVTEFGREAVRGYLASGVVPCLKHFPGHGDVSSDSHDETPIVNKPLEELTQMELQPYLQLAKETPSIMTVHILFPYLDPFQTATLSKTIIQDILRGRIDYHGIVITDSLTMKGAQKGDAGLEQTALMAFLAGNDILLTGGRALLFKNDGEARTDTILSIYNTLLQAVKEGLISEERLNQSVERILRLKEQAGLFEEPPLFKAPLEALCGTIEHLDLAKQIAYHSVEITEGLFPLPLKAKKIAILAPDVLQSRIEQTSFTSLGENAFFYYFNYLNPTQKEITDILEHIDSYDYVVFFSYNAWKRPKQLQFLETISIKRKLNVLVATGDAKDHDFISHVDLKIATYSPSIPSLQVAAEYIIGETNPLHMSPEETVSIGMKIWKNTSEQNTYDLTYWKEGEEFPSMGIGHFTWPPYTYRGPFSKGNFHELLDFFLEHKVPLPPWLEKCHFSPWATRAQFYREIDSEKMKELRAILCNTIPLQANYLRAKLDSAFLDMIRTLSIKERKHLTKQFFHIANTPQGHYILTDYLNFKNSGTDPKERYNEEGWGLLQVIQKMGSEGAPQDPIADFVLSAKTLLEHRIKNAPPERGEELWLPEWLKRLSTYEITP